MEIETIEITIKENPELKGKIHKPVQEGQYPAVLFCHGLASNQKEFGDFPELIAENGYVCMTFDYSGHGKSEGAVGYVSEEGHLYDTRRAVEFLKEQPSVIKNKIHLLGHSLGTGAVLRYMVATNDDDIASVTIAAPVHKLFYNISFFQYLLYFLTFLIANPIFRLVKFHVYMPYSVTPDDIFVDKGAALRAKRDNIILNYISVNNYEYLIRKLDNVESAAKVTKPVMVMVGAKDKIVPTAHSKRVYDALGSKIKRWECFNTSGHSLLGDNQKVEVFNTYMEWLKSI